MKKDKEFWQKPPEKIIEWQDPQSNAKGILVVNELINGACGGGTRVSLSTNIEELTHLAKMMQLKFSVYGPAIGGAKSGIIMDPNDPNKYEVLKRWFEFIKPVLQKHYGTAADLNTNFHQIENILKDMGIPHPQYGIVQSLYKDSKKTDEMIARLKLLKQKIVLENQVEVTVAQMATGYLIAELVKSKQVTSKSVVIQGVGTVGSAAAYYLNKAGYKIIGLIDKENAVISAEGISIKSIISLLKSFSLKHSCDLVIDHKTFFSNIKKYSVPIFIPAAGSYLIDEALANVLLNQKCELMVSGANIPFKNKAIKQRLEKTIDIIPSYISSGGIGYAFSLLMNDQININKAEDILDAISVKCPILD